MLNNRRSSFRGVAALAAVALVATGGVALDAALAPSAHAAYPDSLNPFAMNGGFTVYAREDALLQNQETEGSIAVGGTATVQGSSGQYTIIHVSAGTADYTLPTVDGDPTRFLVGEYSTDSTGILAITSAGTTEPSLLGDLKMVDRDGPWQAFSRADWIRLNTAGSGSPDQTPLIDATAQTYPASATPPDSSTGASSIYTYDTSPTAVADYVEANAEADWDTAQQCLDDLVDPATAIGYPVGVAEDAGSRVVLEPLSPDQPNVVDYSDIAGAALIQFSPGPTPGTENPLIIRVPAGTTSVTGARLDPQGAYSPYTFWDLSQLTGDVTVTAGEGRIDGSIYAPNANITVSAAPLDGQILGNNVTIEGGEVHSFMFAGTIACEADSGTFSVRKDLDGIAEDDLPEGTTFTVNYTATDPDGVETVGTMEIPADGTPVDAETQFPIGTEVVFEEIAPESVPGFDWGTPTISPNPLIVGAGSAEIVVTNAASAAAGTFSVAKSLVDADGETPEGEPSQNTVPVTWTAFSGTEEIGSGVIDVPFDGTPVEVGQDFPVGTRIVLTEDLEGIDPPDGYSWSGASWDPGRTFVIDEDGALVAVSLTNEVVPTPDGDQRVITIVKEAEGDAADPVFDYAVSYNTDPAGTRTTRDLPVGDLQLLDDVETDATVLQLAELLPTFNGNSVDPDMFEVPVIEVTTGGTTTEYAPEGFEGDPSVTNPIVEIPLAFSEDDRIMQIRVVNSLKEGTFELSKEFTSIPGIPGAEFSVEWTATTPTGDVETGVMRLPADGTPVSPIGAGGEPQMFPYGTVITYEELTPPTFARIEWGTATFALGQLVIGTDGAAVVSSTLTNDADLVTGTFEVAKSLAGIEPGELLADSFTIEYEAHVPGDGIQSGTFEIPADGTPAGPVDAEGAPLQFAIGTVVHLEEPEPDASALPPGYEWAETTWDPGARVVIGVGETPVIEVTNSVSQFTRWAGVKVMAGDGASAVSPDTEFPIEWWMDTVRQEDIAVTPNEVVTTRWFPVGTILQIREGPLPEIPGVDWGAPVWTVDGVALTPDDDGRVLLPMTVSRSEGVAELTLTNTATADDLPSTGGSAVPPLVPASALALIAGGLALAVFGRRRIAG